MKRITLLVLALCLILTSFVLPAQAEEPIKIKIAISTDALIEDYNTNWLTGYIEETYNVDLEFIELPSDDASAKLAVLMNAGGELPDIICLRLDATTTLSYANQGLLIPLDDYLDDPEMMKNYWDPYYDMTMEEGNKNLRALTMADGKRYSLPTISAGYWSQSPVKMFINDHWLEVLNLDMPTTTEELYDVLKAFVTMDPNGNGVADEVGIVGGNGWPCCDFIAFLLGSFAVNTVNDKYLYEEDGIVKAAFIEDGFRDGLEFVHRLVEEGLIYEASFTQDVNQVKAMTVVEKPEECVVGIVATSSDTGFCTYEQFMDFYTMMAPVAGPDGVRYAVHTNPEVWGNWYITSACDYPEIAFAIGELGYNPEISLIERFSEKGVNWTDDPEICAQYQSRIPGMGYEVNCAVLDDSPYTMVYNYAWRLRLPYNCNAAWTAKTGLVKQMDDSEATRHQLFNKYYHLWSNERYCTYAYDGVLPMLVYSEEETYLLADIKTSVDSYVSEQIVKFVTGARNLDEWERFKAELYDMDLETYIEIVQTAYDRVAG